MRGRSGDLVLIRGAGDLATGTALRLFNSGYKVVMCECEKPSAIRRTVSFSEAVYNGAAEVEGVKAVRVSRDANEIRGAIDRMQIPVVVDPEAKIISELKPFAVVDAILAKKNTGTAKGCADVVIALGPGFVAGKDVDYVVETKRGHYLGAVIRQGEAASNSGVPGVIGGVGAERVVRSRTEGEFRPLVSIGDRVGKGDAVAKVGEEVLLSAIGGVVRGILPSGFHVTLGFKCADVDPREDSAEYVRTVSDKARAIAGGVLECLMNFEFGRKRFSAHADDGDGVTRIYVDGSFDGEKKAYSFGAVILSGGKILEFRSKGSEGWKIPFRNIAGEVAGATFGMQYCVDNGIGECDLYYDYQGVMSWCTGEWKPGNRLTAEYKEYYESIRDRLSVRFVKVKAHSGDKYNTLADKLAREALDD